MFQGKNKPVTFSYDDGVTQDFRLVEILNRYGLKCTFNLNSGLLGKLGELNCGGVKVNHTKVKPEEVRDLYLGHEVAVHGVTHPNLTSLSQEDAIYQVEQDRKNLEALVGYDICGMAYPNGDTDERIARLLAEQTKIKYSRTVVSTHNFDLQDDLELFDPTVHHGEECLFDLAEEFIALKTDEPKIFYIWGHSYEFDVRNGWDRFEEFCKLISGREDIFYGTNREVLLAGK